MFIFTPEQARTRPSAPTPSGVQDTYTHSSERLRVAEWRVVPRPSHTTNLFLARVLLLVAVSAWAWYPMMVFVESPKRSL